MFKAVTLSPLVPCQKWLLWSKPTLDRSFSVEFNANEILLPSEGIEAKVGEYVEFTATSADVTYGFGAFRPDGTMVFQMQVLRGRQDHITWKFDEPSASGHDDPSPQVRPWLHVRLHDGGV